MNGILSTRNDITGEFEQAKAIIGPKGKDSKSAYEIAVSEGFYCQSRKHFKSCV